MVDIGGEIFVNLFSGIQENLLFATNVYLLFSRKVDGPWPCGYVGPVSQKFNDLGVLS